MKVFPDINVLASAFGTRGLCADVLRLILAEHELVTGEVVIEELRAVLRKKFEVPAATIEQIDGFLRSYHVEPKPREIAELKLSDRNDLLVVGSALKVQAEVLVTDDREILDLKDKPKALRIVNPRAFWNLAVQRCRSVSPGGSRS
ncbi:MAG: PIN domain-containing protein [Deltaproteobacteria bacterium]|nr:PIN domain-containing protein [Deltaproteobacteria bacterium]